MASWAIGFALATVIAIGCVVKIIFLYKDLDEIRNELHERLSEDTNNVIYVAGTDRHLKAFAKSLNQELGILYDLRRRYQNGDKELKEAVTNISHDLRTPLTAIYGYLELLESEPKTETTTHYLSQISDRADALRTLTEELFRYSVTASVQGEKKERIVLNRVLEESLLSYYDIFCKNKIEPQIEIPEEPVIRFLDAGALKRIFQNILDNAVKYSAYQFRVCLLADGTILFQNKTDKLDNISVERLFDRFYTVETGRNATGLGLAIARLLTERMGGSISAQFKENELTIRILF